MALKADWDTIKPILNREIIGFNFPLGQPLIQGSRSSDIIDRRN